MNRPFLTLVLWFDNSVARHSDPYLKRKYKVYVHVQLECRCNEHNRVRANCSAQWTFGIVNYMSYKILVAKNDVWYSSIPLNMYVRSS